MVMGFCCLGVLPGLFFRVDFERGNMTMSLVQDADSQLEYEIEREFQSMLDDEKTGSRQQSLWHADKMRGLILARSPERVAEMERNRGLHG
jgi:hypothetical protein